MVSVGYCRSSGGCRLLVGVGVIVRRHYEWRSGSAMLKTSKIGPGRAKSKCGIGEWVMMVVVVVVRVRCVVLIWPSRELCGIKPRYCETATTRLLQWSDQRLSRECSKLKVGAGKKSGKSRGKGAEKMLSFFVWLLGVVACNCAEDRG